MKTFFAFIGFMFMAFTVALALIVWKIRRRMKAIRDAMQDNMDDETFRRMADKNYNRKHRDDTPQFDEDYFKGDPDGSRRRQKQQSTTRRTTHTAGGVTIIDQRDPNVADRKIFSTNEGEYVDFKEE